MHCYYDRHYNTEIIQKINAFFSSSGFQNLSSKMANGGTTDIFGGESFSMRRPSLLEQLKNILREYPKDFQILHVSLICFILINSKVPPIYVIYKTLILSSKRTTWPKCKTLPKMNILKNIYRMRIVLCAIFCTGIIS